MIYEGSCHCQAVTFQVEAPEALEVEYCNCSICSKAGYLHLIVPRSRFELLTGQDALTDYRFNSQVAQHTFAKFAESSRFIYHAQIPTVWMSMSIVLTHRRCPLPSTNLMENTGSRMHINLPTRVKKTEPGRSLVRCSCGGTSLCML